jgi:hypothetical protein
LFSPSRKPILILDIAYFTVEIAEGVEIEMNKKFRNLCVLRDLCGRGISYFL